VTAEGAPRDDPGDEISVVIRTLREADLRLEELTAGEIDTVTDREGRSFLLQRAQRQLRETGAVKQAAILNSLPAHIMLLDNQGTIVAANDSWRQLNFDDASQGPAYGAGPNYLESCDNAQGAGEMPPHQIAAGIR
jgi:hypothetical protein